jgi:hypothetical protein
MPAAIPSLAPAPVPARVAVPALAGAGVSALAAVDRGLHHLPGRGVLARYGDLVLLCEARPGQDASVNALVDTLAAAHPCGRQLSRRLAGLISTTEPEGGFPALCAFGPAGDGVAALVHGEAELTFTVGGGRELRLDGRDAVTVVDQIVREPIESIRALVGDGDPDREFDRWNRLDAGVVRADALVYGLGPTVDTTPGLALPPMPVVMPAERGAPAELPAAGPSGVVGTDEEPAEPAGQAELGTPGERPESHAQEEPVMQADPVTQEARSAGDPVVPQPRQPVAEAGPVGVIAPQVGPAEPEPVRVIGVYCKKEHFNDPKVAYCTVCGIAMAQATRLPVMGVRPPLGVLVLDDGTMFPLVRDHVLGRTPEEDEAVAAGRASGLSLLDPLVSRVHARIVLDGWQVCVVDENSTNGTFLWGPGDTSWTRLPRGATAPLHPGSVTAIGQRQLRYHSYRNN